MNSDQREVLNTLYQLESARMAVNDFDGWTTANEISAAISPAREEVWVRQQLDSLWIARKVMQVPDDLDADFQLVDVELSGTDLHGSTEARIRVDPDDCRGASNHHFEQVAQFGQKCRLRYRSRVAEIARLLQCNYQRFGMVPTTGLLRYERRPQRRPLYDQSLSRIATEWATEIRSGSVNTGGVIGLDESYTLAADIDREQLAVAVESVLLSLGQIFQQRGRNENLALFQVHSILRTLLGLYCPGYRADYDAHVVTAGVGSGKSFAFQVGAVIHVTYKALIDDRRLQVLLLYPRVVLAANQFQDLFDLFNRVEETLHIGLQQPFLDAGGYLQQQMQVGEVTGGLFQAIRRAYQGVEQLTQYQVAISNLDTLANRIVHPECCAELTRGLDLIVFDEAHLLSGLYGAHTKMFLKRMELQRAMWRLREQLPLAHFEDLLARNDEVGSAYFIAASATMAEPMRHVSRIIGREESRIASVEIDADQTTETGWIHHLFLRQRPEASSMSAVTNATSCLIHNRRDGLHREYYQHTESDGQRPPISLSALSNPILPAENVELRSPRAIHKTLGFCDSLDGVGRWADLVADNEQTKTESMKHSANPGLGNMPYFMRFQEPLWRTIHHISFGASIPIWAQSLTQQYGELCRKCKKGIRARAQRIPAGLTAAQRNRAEELWRVNPSDPSYNKSYLDRMEVGKEHQGSSRFAAVVEAANSEQIENLDHCPFFETKLCWWWSMDHLGNNKPTPVSTQNPMDGFKQPRANTVEPQYLCVNSIRVRSFTSQQNFDALATDSIDDLYRSRSDYLLRGRGFSDDDEDNCCFVIGSPRLEVGIDLSRASDGITFRAMRDPASLQQKTGRVGRELYADSLLVHIVTENARDHYYFRNPRIALDPEFLQPVRLHEDNQIINRNHYFMAIVDFLCQQGVGPLDGRITSGGERINLINDHGSSPAFEGGWERKVNAVWQFLAGDHSRQTRNRENVIRYLEILGARTEEISNPAVAATLGPGDSATLPNLGALDVFLHEFGPNLLLTPLASQYGMTNLAQVCSYRYAPTNIFASNLPRHQEVLDWLGAVQNPRKERSYLWNILTIPLFLRGIPENGMPSNQPFLWTSNFFEPVGNRYVSVFEERNTRTRELGAEPVSLALALLTPGTFSFRYTSAVRKVPVSQYACTGLATQTPGREERVWIDVDNNEFFESVACNPLDQRDVPDGFTWTGQPVPVFSPRRIGLARANSNPRPTVDGLIADNDERPFLSTPQLPNLATPPRCYALRWFRLVDNNPSQIECRFANRFRGVRGQQLSPLPLPEITQIFSSIAYDRRLQVTEFVWGLDRQFMTRQVDAARLLYWQANTNQPAPLGETYEAPSLRFELDLSDGSPIGQSLLEVWNQPQSGVHQSLLLQVLTAFLNRFAGIRDANAPPWVPPQPPSVFTVRNLRTIVLFNLLDIWHPADAEGIAPTGPFWLSLDDIIGCFRSDHTAFITQQRFAQLCQRIAQIQNAASPAARQITLESAYENFCNACQQVDQLNPGFAVEQSRDLFLNTLGVSLQAAALRQTGAESSDIGYFYRRSGSTAAIYLFDTDAYGNGSIDVVNRNFYVSSAERFLLTRQRAMGVQVDVLPTTDFVHCLDEELQECASSHAAQLAYHNVTDNSGPLATLTAPRIGERQIAGTMFDFLRQQLGLSNFDSVVALQACPEFIASLGTYSVHSANWQFPSPKFPTFEALESAVGYCHHGCIECVLAPELNLHGVLNARDTVNKLLLDTVYRTVICESPNAAGAYPGTGPSRTCSFEELAQTVASSIGVSVVGDSQIVELPMEEGATTIVVTPQYSPGGWFLVFRTGWVHDGPPVCRIRPHMEM